MKSTRVPTRLVSLPGASGDLRFRQPVADRLDHPDGIGNVKIG
jgi:hypothetical protein